MSNDIQQRLDDLEAHLTHQDATIQDLNEVTLQQWNEIKALTEKLARLETKIQAAEEAGDAGATPEPPPPHY
ncbi:MAG: SlyX protein [Alphaproteobacteria bacterium]|nr:SlyX protein [Alphaproteobacteria bacterium]